MGYPAERCVRCPTLFDWGSAFPPPSGLSFTPRGCKAYFLLSFGGWQSKRGGLVEDPISPPPGHTVCPRSLGCPGQGDAPPPTINFRWGGGAGRGPDQPPPPALSSERWSGGSGSDRPLRDAGRSPMSACPMVSRGINWNNEICKWKINL